jgi:transcription antitermination factor NusG
MSKRPPHYRPRYIGDHVKLISGEFKGHTGTVREKHDWKSEGELGMEWVYSVELDTTTIINVGEPFGAVSGKTTNIGALPSEWMRIK